MPSKNLCLSNNGWQMGVVCIDLNALFSTNTSPIIKSSPSWMADNHFQRLLKSKDDYFERNSIGKFELLIGTELHRQGVQAACACKHFVHMTRKRTVLAAVGRRCRGTEAKCHTGPCTARCGTTQPSGRRRAASHSLARHT